MMFVAKAQSVKTKIESFILVNSIEQSWDRQEIECAAAPRSDNFPGVVFPSTARKPSFLDSRLRQTEFARR